MLGLLRDLPMVLLAGKPTMETTELSGQDPFVSGSSAEAIRHHYDISNAFYRSSSTSAWSYSCGYFTDFANDMDQAQADKLDHICRKLRLQPGERLLDIGCGWGAMLIHAAKHYWVIGHGVSLSERQTELARERIRAEGLEDRITIEIESYADLEGSFDKICSIGMCTSGSQTTPLISPPYITCSTRTASTSITRSPGARRARGARRCISDPESSRPWGSSAAAARQSCRRQEPIYTSRVCNFGRWPNPSTNSPISLPILPQKGADRERGFS